MKLKIHPLYIGDIKFYNYIEPLYEIKNYLKIIILEKTSYVLLVDVEIKDKDITIVNNRLNYIEEYKYYFREILNLSKNKINEYTTEKIFGLFNFSKDKNEKDMLFLIYIFYNKFDNTYITMQFNYDKDYNIINYFHIPKLSFSDDKVENLFHKNITKINADKLELTENITNIYLLYRKIDLTDNETKHPLKGIEYLLPENIIQEKENNNIPLFVDNRFPYPKLWKEDRVFMFIPDEVKEIKTDFSTGTVFARFNN